MANTRLWLRFRRNPGALVGGLIVVLVLLMAVFAPLLAPYDPEDRDFARRFQAPSAQYLLGTDHFGRDNLSRIILGSRVSVQVGLLSVGLAILIGVTLGALAGYLGGWADTLISRTVDVFLAFPPILLALALVAALGPSVVSVIVALGLVYWTTYARVVRSSILALREEEFVEASRALGAAWR